MNRTKKILLIIGIIITGVVISSVIGFIVIVVFTSNQEDGGYSHQTTLYIEGKKDYMTYVSAINFAKHRGDTLTFSFTTEPNGLIEVYLYRQDGSHFDLFITTNITNYELVLPDDSCSLSFANLELFDIIVSLSYSIK